MGFDLHEEEGGSGVEIVNVGLVINKRSGVLTHKPERAWRPHRCTKYLLSTRHTTGEVIRVWLGHCVHYCELMRLGMSISTLLISLSSLLSVSLLSFLIPLSVR